MHNCHDYDKEKFIVKYLDRIDKLGFILSCDL